MKPYGFLLLIITFSLRAADNTSNSAIPLQVSALRQKCAAVAIECFLLDLKKKCLVVGSPERNAYEALSVERIKLEKGELNKVNDPTVKAMLFGDSYKEKIELLYKKYTGNKTPRRVFDHMPLDSNQEAITLALEVKKNKDDVIQLYKELFSTK